MLIFYSRIPKRELKDIIEPRPCLRIENPEKGVERIYGHCWHIIYDVGIPKRELKVLIEKFCHIESQV